LASDGVSKVTGTLTENKNGAVCGFVLSGTYTVNSDGTGTINVTQTPTSAGCTGSPVTEASVLFNMGSGAAFVNTTGGVSLGSLTRQK